VICFNPFTTQRANPEPFNQETSRMAYNSPLEHIGANQSPPAPDVFAQMAQ
jgi:hypothetical protein